jgi:protein O-GlcNAc transferase
MNTLSPDAAIHRQLGAALLTAGQPAEAAKALRIAISLDPHNSRGHNNLGQALMQQGDVRSAIASYECALVCDPNYAIGHSNLGLALLELGDFELAEASLRRALEVQPTLGVAHLNLGVLLERRERLTEALESYDQAIGLMPEQFECWVARGSVLAGLSRYERALQCFDRALTLRGPDALTLVRKASVLLSLERAEEALASADHALRVDSDLAEGHNIRAGALRQLNRLTEAMGCFDKALEANPAFVDGWCNRGMLSHELGDIAAAVDSYRQALALDPLCARARVRLVSAQIPAVPDSAAQSSRARAAFDHELGLLEPWFDATVLTATDAHTAARQQLFYLSYHEASNKTLLKRYRQATAAQLSRVTGVPSSAARVPRRGASSRHRLGFVSAHVYDHSVFNAILQGWLQCLDRSRFELTLFNLGTRADAMTATACGAVDHVDSGARSYAEWVTSIREHNLDTLIYPEIGMHEMVLALANLRLAPRQCVAWGHPETSGLPTIDCFLSAEAFEPSDAQDHYTERLIRLPNLGVHVGRPATAAQRVDLAALGISGSGPLYVCAGVPFKYQPQDDEVLVEIARRLGACTFIFFAHEKIELSKRLMTRIAAAFRRANLDPDRFIILIPWQSRESFLGLLQQADVYLDTIGFSGFNTVMQAIEAGLPCVAYEGRFMRGRLGSGIMQRLGLPELIAADKARYIDTAVHLGEDARHRAQLRERIRASEPALYADRSAVDALASLLLAPP